MQSERYHFWAWQSKPCEQINWKGGLCLVHHHPGDFQYKRPPQKQRKADGLEPKWLQRKQIKQFLTFLFFSPYHCPWHDWLHLFSKFLRNMMRLTLFHKPSQPRSSPFFSAERRMCLIINYRRSVSYWQDKIMSLFQSLSSSNCGSLSGYNSHFCLFCLHRRRLDPVLALPKNSYDPSYFQSLPNSRIQSVPTYSSWSNFASRVVYQLRWQVLCDNAKSVACPDMYFQWYPVTLYYALWSLRCVCCSVKSRHWNRSSMYQNSLQSFNCTGRGVNKQQRQRPPDFWTLTLLFYQERLYSCLGSVFKVPLSWAKIKEQCVSCRLLWEVAWWVEESSSSFSFPVNPAWWLSKTAGEHSETQVTLFLKIWDDVGVDRGCYAL